VTVPASCSFNVSTASDSYRSPAFMVTHRHDVPSVEPVLRRDFTVILEVFSRISYRRLLHSGAFFLSHFWGIEALWDRHQIHRLTPWEARFQRGFPTQHRIDRSSDLLEHSLRKP
jgi:hypothetical protein